MPGKMILQKTAENQGNGFYQIEQELTFQAGAESVVVRETWISDGERGLKVMAHGQNELKDKFKFQAVYVGGQKWTVIKNLKQNQKIPLELIERPFHFRTTEGLASYLMSLDILPENFLSQKAYTREKENFKYTSEPYLRLGRSQGVINYTFGAAAVEDQTKMQPGAWIEQDQFVFRKIRFPSQAELLVDEIGSYSKGYIYPKIRTLRYGNQTVQIKTISVQSRTNMPNAFQVNNLESTFDNVDNPNAKETLNQFYSKFR